MNKNLNKIKQLSAKDWLVLLNAILLLPLIAIGLYMSGYKRTRRFMAHFVPANTTKKKHNIESVRRAEMTARMVDIAAKHGFFRTDCLKKSLVTWWLLGRKGIESEIIFGIQKEEQDLLHAHAWVEYKGVPLGESRDAIQQFTVVKNTSKLYL